MKCPNCQFENRDDAKFCKSCGHKLEGLHVKPESAAEAMPLCPGCGAALKPGAKFCTKCGTSVAASPAPAPVPESAPAPEPVPVPEPAPAPEVHTCSSCGAVLKPGVKFCSKCGSTVSSSTAPASVPAAAPVPQPAETKVQTPAAKPAEAKIQTPVQTPPTVPVSARVSEKPDAKKKAPIVPILCALVVLFLLGCGVFALAKAGLFSGSEKNGGNENAVTEDLTASEEDPAAITEEDLAPIAEQVTAAEDKMNNNDYAGASADLTDVLNAYADLVSEDDSEDTANTVIPLAETAFDLYTKSILKQVEGWEGQPPTAPLYQQVDITMKDSFAFADQLKESGLTINTDALEADYEAFPGRYKEKYILAFNDLVTGEEWSRTTAWMYMQDAASVGLVDRENPDDPLTLRYAYALAWITQKETSEGRNDGTLSDEDAIATILSVAKNADYNPVLMRELALCYDAVGNTNNSALIKNACIDVCNYLANSEAVFINPDDLFVPGRNSDASSTIALNSFWYFNDFGDYSASITNGLRTEGREYIRTRYQEAFNSLT